MENFYIFLVENMLPFPLIPYEAFLTHYINNFKDRCKLLQILFPSNNFFLKSRTSLLITFKIEVNLFGKFNVISECLYTFGRYKYSIKISQAQVWSRVFELSHNNFDEGQQETYIKQLRDFF